MSGGFHGVTIGPTGTTEKTKSAVPSSASVMLGLPDNAETPSEEVDPFAGMGPWLEEEDEKVYQSVNEMVLRQEIPALNQLAMDTHWTYVKLGYPWSNLTKEPGTSRYTQSLPYGMAGVTIQAVPNKAWDLVNKTTEALLQDFPQVEAEPGDDSEQARASCDYITRFLTQNASEQGTNDAVLWNDRVNRALTCASSFVECWTDPTGGGYVPLQIPAHPQAVSPTSPLVGPDGMPTPSPIMRYVTAVGPDGEPTEESQFTDDATQAAPQWQPKLMAQRWQNEHIRIFPETKSVDEAEKVIVLGYCTLGEAKRRWPEVAAMSPDELSKLTDWTPTRYFVLLPFFLRGRWKLTDGRGKEKQGSSDERIMFYYHPYIKACPDYKKGADVVVTGAFQGRILDKKFLSTEVEVPSSPDESQTPVGVAPVQTEQPASKKETRCMEIPVVQITPRQDPDEQNPRGRAYIELFAGAVENNAHLAMSASQVIDRNLHLEGYLSSTSPVTGQQREDARASGDMIPLIRAEDKPQWGPVLPFEPAFFNFFELSDEATNSIASAERAAKGSQQSAERSGKAIQLATANNNVSLGGMNHAVNNAYCRWNRIKTERAMGDFTVAEQINYVGEDGIFKQQSLTSVDFAAVGKVTIKTGTGSLVNPDQKVQNLAGLVQVGMLDADAASEAARPAFSRKLGLPASPHEQRMERQITAFNKGVPSPEWVMEWQQFQQQKAVFDAAQAQAQQQASLQTTATSAQTGNAPVPVPAAPPVGPDGQPMRPPQMPWTPFQPMPTDDEPMIAKMRRTKLARLIDTAKFESFPPEWQEVAKMEYVRMRTVEAQAAQMAAQAQSSQASQPKQAGAAPQAPGAV